MGVSRKGIDQIISRARYINGGGEKKKGACGLRPCGGGGVGVFFFWVTQNLVGQMTTFGERVS